MREKRLKNVIAHVCAVAVLCIGTALAADPGIMVSAKPRYPWNELVDLHFTITGTAGTKYDTSFTAKDMVGNTNIAMRTIRKADGTAAAATEQLLPGTYSWIWDAAADLPRDFVSDRVVVEGTAELYNPLYMVIDLSGGSNASSYPISYLSAVPSDGWTDTYKTTNLVLRRVEPSSYTSSNGKTVTLTKPYYIGIFECTQKQYTLIVGSNPSYYKGDGRPVESVSYDLIRGTSKGAKWPTSSDVDATSFMGKLRTRTQQSFDLPTCAQWECACLGGESASMVFSRSLSRVNDNKSDGKGGFSGSHTKVGSYSSNLWGIYDMIGNVHEWVLDCNREFTMQGSDPVGPSCYWSDGTLCKMRVVMGEAWHSDDSFPSYTMSALRKSWD